MEIRQKIALVLFIFIAAAMYATSVSAAAVTPGSRDLYMAPSEAQSFSSSTTVACDNNAFSCSDAEHDTVTDRFTSLGDGNTQTGFSMRNLSNTNSRYFKVVFDLTGTAQDGNFSIRMAHADFGEHAICAYINETHVNESSCVFVNGNGGNTITWDNHIIDEVVRESYDRFGRVILRVTPTTSDPVEVREIYLARPFLPSDFDIVPTGVSQTEQNQSVVNTWLVASRTEVESSPSIVLNDCHVERLDPNGPVNSVLLNSSQLAFEYNTDDRHFSVRWFANSSAGAQEGLNYQVHCNATIGGVTFAQVTQYVYINNDRTFLEFLQNIWTYVQNIFTIVDENDVSEIDAFDTVTMDISDASGFIGQDKRVTLVASTSRLALDNVSCSMNVYGPQTKWIDNQSMTSLGYDGIHEINVTLPQEIGSHRATATCTNGTLVNTTIRGTTSWEVTDGARMESIT